MKFCTVQFSQNTTTHVGESAKELSTQVKTTRFVRVRFFWGKSENGSFIQDHLNYGSSRELKNPSPEWIPRIFLKKRTLSGSPQRDFRDIVTLGFSQIEGRKKLLRRVPYGVSKTG